MAEGSQSNILKYQPCKKKLTINLLRSVFVKASWHSGGSLHVEANAWSSAEVDAAVCRSVAPVRTEPADPEGKHGNN